MSQEKLIMGEGGKTSRKIMWGQKNEGVLKVKLDTTLLQTIHPSILS